MAMCWPEPTLPDACGMWAVPCAVGELCMGPFIWAQRALTKGEEVAGGLSIREAMCTHTCMPTYPTVPGLEGGGLCTCVHAHCSGWDESGHLRSVFDPVYASLRFGGPSCNPSLSRGIGVLQRPSSYNYSPRSCCQGWRRWQLGPSYSLLAKVAAAYPRDWER